MIEHLILAGIVILMFASLFIPVLIEGLRNRFPNIRRWAWFLTYALFAIGFWLLIALNMSQ